MNEKEQFGRKLAFKCCVPYNMATCSDDDLRVSLVTLKNALANVTVCIKRLERELNKRGVPHSILQAYRGKVSPEILEVIESMNKSSESAVV